MAAGAMRQVTPLPRLCAAMAAHGAIGNDTRQSGTRRRCAASLQPLGNQLHGYGHSLATTNAKRCNTALFAIRLQSVDQSGENTSAGGADGVAEGAGAAVDVYPGMVDIDVLHRDHGDRGESLVDFIEVGVMRAPAEFRQDLFDGANGGNGEPLRFLRMAGIREHASDWLQASCLRSSGARENECGSAVGN